MNIERFLERENNRKEKHHRIAETTAIKRRKLEAMEMIKRLQGAYADNVIWSDLRPYETTNRTNS